MKMTKQIATQVAKKMAKPLFDEAERLKGLYVVKVEAVHMSRLPKGVVSLFTDPVARNYIRQATYFRVVGPGMQGYGDDRAVTFSSTRPHNAHGTPTIDLMLSDKPVVDAYNNYWAAKEAAEKLQLEIQTALLNLKTLTNIKKALPEALPFLPEQQTSAIAVSLDPLREILSSLHNQNKAQTNGNS